MIGEGAGGGGESEDFPTGGPRNHEREHDLQGNDAEAVPECGRVRADQRSDLRVLPEYLLGTIPVRFGIARVGKVGYRMSHELDFRNRETDMGRGMDPCPSRMREFGLKKY